MKSRSKEPQNMQDDQNKGEIVVYQSDDGRIKLEVRLQDETVWLTQQLIAELFQTTVPNISMHIRNIFEEGELTPEATIKKFLTVRREGSRDVRRELEFYNLDMIISVGYRVKSLLAARFRIWAACARNFATAVHDWCDRELSEFELHLMPLAFVDLPTDMDGFLLNAEEKNFLSFLEALDKPQADPDSPYLVTVNIELKFTRTKAKDALVAQITNDPDAIEVRLTDEQFREKYPQDYQRLTVECAKRYSDFEQDKTYHTVRKVLFNDSLFGAIRYLDPGNPKSAKKPFFNPNILNEMDKHYTKKAAAGRGNAT